METAHSAKEQQCQEKIHSMQTKYLPLLKQLMDEHKQNKHHEFDFDDIVKIHGVLASQDTSASIEELHKYEQTLENIQKINECSKFNRGEAKEDTSFNLEYQHAVIVKGKKSKKDNESNKEAIARESSTCADPLAQPLDQFDIAQFITNEEMSNAAFTEFNIIPRSEPDGEEINDDNGQDFTQTLNSRSGASLKEPIPNRSQHKSNENVTSDEDEFKNNVEIINISEDSNEEMILPDITDAEFEREFPCHANQNVENDNKTSKPVERQAVVNENNADINSENCSSEQKQQSTSSENFTESIIENGKNNENDNPDHDDDEVQIIEVRNSPICLDTDEEDNSPLEYNSDAVKPLEYMQEAMPSSSCPKENATPQPAIQPKMRTIPNILRKSRGFGNSNREFNAIVIPQQQLIDTIVLSDSSDDDEQITAIRTPTEKLRTGNIANEVTLAHCNLLTSRKKTQAGKPERIPDKCNQKTSSIKKKKAETETFIQPNVSKTTALQTNFLNAFNLKPTVTATVSNPRSFSAQLSNKSVIIPNALYTTRAQQQNRVENEQTNKILEEQRIAYYHNWLENFLEQFANSNQQATHSCYILLQRVLKYRVFFEIKERRKYLDSVFNPTHQMVDTKLILYLRTIFYNGPSKRLSPTGRLFCELGCAHRTKTTWTLTVDATSGIATSRTHKIEEMELEQNKLTKNEDDSKQSISCIKKIENEILASSVTNKKMKPLTGRKTYLRMHRQSTSAYKPDSTSLQRKINKEDQEYLPDELPNTFKKMVEPMTGRKMTLRTQRKRRYDNDFSYNEDDDESENCTSKSQVRSGTKRSLTANTSDDWPKKNVSKRMEMLPKSIETNATCTEVDHKVDEKSIGAQRRCELQAKSFENAFIETFAKTFDEAVVKSVFSSAALVRDEIEKARETRQKGDQETSVGQASANKTRVISSTVTVPDSNENMLYQENGSKQETVYNTRKTAAADLTAVVRAKYPPLKNGPSRSQPTARKRCSAPYKRESLPKTYRNVTIKDTRLAASNGSPFNDFEKNLNVFVVHSGSDQKTENSNG